MRVFYVNMSTRRVHNVRFYNLEPRAIHCLAYERGLRKLALSRSDGSIEIWDLSHTPHLERTIPARVNYSVECLTWCKKRLFSAGLQGSVTEYDIQKLTVKFDIAVTAGPCWCLAKEGLLFEKILDRQEGRILCISWDATGDVIVTGSIDAVRVWNVETGHAIYRMTPGRVEGRITFWDGNVGTQIESYQSHKADILCLCLSEDETNVYCAGVDPLIMCFTKVKMKSGNNTSGNKTKWVKSVQRWIHDHDVRALTLADGKLFSAEARYIMLRYAVHIEVWQLGSASPVEEAYGVQEGALPLVQDSVQLLTLKSRGGDAIGNKPVLQKVPVSFDNGSAHRIKFMPSNTEVVIATSTGDVAIMKLIVTKDAIHLLVVSQDGKYIIAADLQSSIVVWTSPDLKKHYSLPRYKCAPTAMAVHPSTNELVVVYADHKIIEYNLSQRKYTDFSRGLEQRHPTQWLSRSYTVNNITFDPHKDDVILLHDDNTICVINKTKKLPLKEAKIPRIGSPHTTSDSLDGSHPRTFTPQNAFHVIKKYKHLVYLQSLRDDELIAVELNPLTLMEKLPPSLKQKKFGGM
ncbi:hypothetical protein C0J52_00311 [Blattella germanica]|nr:hypothetical protein C0J52_00311 [Blattella germanica]